MSIVVRPQKTYEAWRDPEAIPFVQVQNLTKRYFGRKVVHNMDLSVYKGELFTLLGRSGCGKSTLLRVLAGFEEPSTGKVFIDERDMTHIPPYRRPVSMVFQSYALFPHMTVSENVAFGLQQDHVHHQEIKYLVGKYLELVQMSGYEKRYPDSLSGGEKQRVALARSLAKKPKVVLLDEPMAALDKQLRERTQLELVNLQEQIGVTFIMVSHDQEEAMTMSTRIGIMHEGKLVQIGTPSSVYEYPNSAYVAKFIGSINMLYGTVTQDGPIYTEIESSAVHSKIVAPTHNPAHTGMNVCVAVRPEKISLSKEIPADMTCNWARGIVQDIVYLGDVSTYYVLLESGLIMLSTLTNTTRTIDMQISWDDEVYMSWKADNSVLLTR